MNIEIPATLTAHFAITFGEAPEYRDDEGLLVIKFGNEEIVKIAYSYETNHYLFSNNKETVDFEVNEIVAGLLKKVFQNALESR